MSTPEGKVKDAVRKLLSQYSGMYLYMPVPSGYGRTSIDFLGCYRGQFFAIETKAEGKKPTLRQVAELENIGRAMGATFVIAGVEDPAIEGLHAWLDNLTETINDNPHIPRDTVNRRTI